MAEDFDGFLEGDTGGHGDTGLAAEGGAWGLGDEVHDFSK